MNTHGGGVCPRFTLSAAAFLCLAAVSAGQTEVVLEPPATETNVLSGDIYLVVGKSRAQDGVVTLAPEGGTNAYSGRTEIYRATLRADEGVGLPVASRLVFNSNNHTQPAVLEGEGALVRNIGQATGEVYWVNAGGFSAHGGEFAVTLEAGATLDWGGATNGFNGKWLMLNSPDADSRVELTNPIDLTTGDRYVMVFDNPDTTGDVAVLSGDITGSNHGTWFRKYGDGVLWLTGSNDYHQVQLIYGGALRVDSEDVLSTNSTLRFEESNWQIQSVLETAGTLTKDAGTAIETNAITWVQAGGFAAYGGPLSVNLEGGATLDVGVADTGFNGRVLQLGSKTATDVVTLENDLVMTNRAFHVCTFDNPYSNTDYAVLAGDISYGGWGDLYARGWGTLNIRGDNTIRHFGIYEQAIALANGVHRGTGYVWTEAGHGGTLGGTGVVFASWVEIRSGGTLAPGNGGVGTLTLNMHSYEFQMLDGSTYEWELGPGNAHDRAVIDGDLVLDTTWTLKIVDAGGVPRAGDEYTLFTYTKALSSTTWGSNQLASVTIDTSETGWVADGAAVMHDAVNKRVYLTGLSSALDVANTQATGITDTTATLGGTVSGTGEVLHVWAYWGETDGGSTPGAWDREEYVGAVTNAADATVAHDVASLTTNTAYVYTFRATNATHDLWATPAGAFVTAGLPAVDGVGATDVGRGLATLGGRFLDHNRGDVTICWGLSDGGATTSGWEHVVVLGAETAETFETTVAGALYPLTYYYRCYATNAYGDDWSDTATTFSVVRRPDSVHRLPDLDGLVVAYDAGEGVTTNADGTVVTWADQSGNGHDAVAVPYADDPVLAAGEVNGRPAVQFRKADGDDYLEVAGNLFTKEQYIVWRSPNAVFDAYGTIYGNRYTRSSSYIVETGQTYFHRNQYPVEVHKNGAPLPNPFNVGPMTDYMVMKVTVNDNDTSSKGHWFGRQDSWSFSMDVAELIGYGRALSDGEENLLGGYLAAKYGIASSYTGYAGNPLGIANAQPTDVTTDSAMLSGELQVSNAVCDVWVYWGGIDHTTNAQLWGDSAYVGSFSNFVGGIQHTVSGLDPTNYFAFRATNALDDMWAAPSQSFLPVVIPVVNNSTGATPAEGSATLRGELTAGNSADVTVYWGRADGGTNAAMWDSAVVLDDTLQGELSSVVQAGYGVTYYYRCYATNAAGVDWADATETFTTARPWTHYRAGLLGGTLGGWNTTGANPGTTGYLGPHTGATQTRPPWADNITWVYTGEVYFNGGTYHWAEHIDDRAMLAIDGMTYILNTAWNVPTRSGPIAKPSGWYPIDIRFSNGAGGCGPVAGYGWTATKGFGYNIDGNDTTDGSDYTYPEDPGDATLFRHIPPGWGGEAVPPELATVAPTDITPSTATLNGRLEGDDWFFDVVVCWGETDGGTTVGGWDHNESLGSFTNYEGDLSFAASGLNSGTAYYYTFHATNDMTNLWASPAMMFSAMSAPQVATLAAAGVSNASATLRGQLLSGGAGEATMYWGLSDGGTNAGSWPHATPVGTVLDGEFATSVSVRAGGTYYCRAYVTNAVGADWADSSESFATPSASVSLNVAIAGVEPLDVPGCILWLDAGDVDGDGTPATDPPAGSTITSWTDLSGVGHDADNYQGDPSFVAAGLNGRPVISFDGNGNDHLFTSHDFRYVTEYSVFLVARYTGGDNERVLSSKDVNWLFGYHGNLDERFYANGWIATTGSANTNWHVHAGTMSDDPNPRGALWKDGARITYNHGGSSDTDYKPGRLSIGGHNTTEFSKCEVAEVLFYERELSQDEVAEIGSYLARKHGVSATYAPSLIREAGGTAVITAALDVPAVADVTVDLALTGSGAMGLLHKGYHIAPDALMNIHNNGGIMTETPHGVTVLTDGPGGRGLDFDSDADFIYTGAVNAGDYYMNLFLGHFHATETGDYQFRNGGDDDRCGIWLDLDRDGVFEAPAGHGNGESISWEDGGGKSRYLYAGNSYLFAVTHGELTSASRVDVRFKRPSMAAEAIINPGDPAQRGLWTYTQSVPGYGTDYTSTPVTVVIPAGSLSAEVVLTAIDDVEQEEDEGITAAIDTVVNAETGMPDRVAATLSSDDPLITNGDGATGVGGPSATLNGVLSMGDSASVSVYWGDNDGGTDTSNWDTAIGIGHTVEDARFSTELTGLLAGATYYYRCYATNGSLLAEDWADESSSFTMPLAGISVSDVAVMEGDAGTVNAVFAVTLTATGVADAVVSFSTDGGTATAGADYVATNGTLRIPAGQTSGQIVVRVNGDTLFEHPPETFALTLSNPSGCELADATATGTIGDDDARRHLADWLYRMKIEFSGYAGSETLTNWPALVRLDAGIASFDYTAFASTTGGDLRFASADESVLLSYEIERWDTNGESVVWVRVPELPASGTHIWAYWGNADETAVPLYTTDGSTWSEGYRVVQHLADVSGTTATDSSPDRRSCTLVGSGMWGATGSIASAFRFTGNDNDRFELTAAGYVDLSGGEWSGGAWFRNLNTNSHDTLFRSEAAAGSDHQIIIWTGGNDLGSYDGAFRDSGGDLDRSLTGWHHVMGVGVGTVTRFYVDGVHVGDAPTKAVSDIRSIGNHWGGGQKWSEYLDEVRISDVARSADWVLASYSNQVPGSTFSMYTAGGRPNIEIVDGATGIDASSATLTATLTTTGTAATTVWAYWGESNGGENASLWSIGVSLGVATQALPAALSTNVTGLTGSTHYYYAYMASNAHATSWAAADFYTHGLPAIDNGQGATPTAGYATLSGNLLSTGGVETTVYTYWGESDGGTNGASWDRIITNGVLAEGAFSADTPHTLLVGRTYYYRCRAENANGPAWAGTTESFAAADLHGEGYRLKIDFDGYTGSETLTNFPALVTLNEDVDGFSYNGFLSSEGHDLRFWDAALARELNYEIERWSPDVEFNPAGIPNCAFWLDADDAGSFTLESGSNVKAWRDKSPNVNRATRHDHATPAAIQRMTGVLNGRAVVRFAPDGGNNDILNLLEDVMLDTGPGGSGLSAFVVGRTTDSSGQDTVMSGPGNYQFFRQNDARMHFYNGTGGDPYLDGQPLTTWRVQYLEEDFDALPRLRLPGVSP